MADLAPFAFRAAAYVEVGGLDEGLAEPGECAIAQDYELSTRLWLSGWQVGRMAGRGGGRMFGMAGTGSTHVNHFSQLQCWSKQSYLMAAANVRGTVEAKRRVWHAVRDANAAQLQLMLAGAPPPWEQCCLDAPTAERQYCGDVRSNTYPDDYPTFTYG